MLLMPRDYSFNSYSDYTYSESYSDSYWYLLLPEIGRQIKRHKNKMVSKIKRHFKTSPVFLSALIVVYRLLSRSRLMPLEVCIFSQSYLLTASALSFL